MNQILNERELATENYLFWVKQASQLAERRQTVLSFKCQWDCLMLGEMHQLAIRRQQQAREQLNALKP